jgi:predicted phosphodiesterase
MFAYIKEKKSIGCLLAAVALGCFTVWYAVHYTEALYRNTASADSSSQKSDKLVDDFRANVIAVGDIACPAGKPTTATECQQDAVAESILAQKPDNLLLLGDVQYLTGSSEDLTVSFLKKWQPLLQKSSIVIGNHDYKTDQGSPLRDVAAQNGATITTADAPFVKQDIKGWDVYLLDSNCEFVGGCGKDSVQYKWFQEELAKSTNQCSIAMWHHPVSSSSHYAFSKPDLERMQDIWELASENHVDIVLNGHEHIYERFSPVTVSEGVSVMRQFTVGTGGYDLRQVSNNTPYSEKAISSDFGYLKLELRHHSYSWQFVSSLTGNSLDSGSDICVQ